MTQHVQFPPYSLSQEVQDEMRRQTVAMAKELGVIGLMNVQFAVKGDDIYILEVNPRASRTVPFVSKCIGESLAKVAARCMAGQSLNLKVSPRNHSDPLCSKRSGVPIC